MKRALEIGQEMLAANVRPLTEDECGILIQLALLDLQKVAITDEMKETFLYQICATRLESAGVPVEEIVPMYVAAISDRPGIAVLYAAACRAIYEQVKRPVSLTDMIDAFPMGVPTEEEMHKIWEAQKVNARPDNSLDYMETWV